MNKNCKICGKSFVAAVHNAVYCSKECKRVVNLQRQKKYYKENKEEFSKKHKEWQKNNSEYRKEYGKKWREENKEYIKEYHKTENYKEKEKRSRKKYYAKNKEKLLKQCKEWREKKKELDPNYNIERYYKHRNNQLARKRKKYEEEKDIHLAKNKEWRGKNQAWMKQYKAERRTIDKDRIIQRYREEPSFRLKVILRRRIADCIKRNKMSKDLHTMELLGTHIETARKHIENQFKEGMTWENHGNKGWHIDHIIPCSAFDLTDIEQQKKCFHYTNLQPLWWWENLSKQNKLDWKGMED